MPIPALQAAKAICEKSGWTVSNLALQKLLYIAHMIHIGNHGEPLIEEVFEAWDYGPVVPEVYHKAKIFGRDPVQNIFHQVAALEDGSPALATISAVVESLHGLSPAQLVAATHWEKGAWAAHYESGRSNVIPNQDIKAEYFSRWPVQTA